MKEIPLTRGQIALVDDEDYERLSRHKWYASWDPTTHSFYAQRTLPRDNGVKRSVRMARVIMDALLGETIDHINHDTLDNRRSNLRKCSGAENNRNKMGNRRSTSRFKGVSFDKRSGKWRAFISRDGHQRCLGYFLSEWAAAIVYDRNAIEVYREFAFLNFRDGAGQ